MSTPFRNNLAAGDAVQHAVTKRPGNVRWARETSIWAGVVWQGTTSPQQVHVSKLRLVVNGVAEEVPPVDGEIPPIVDVEKPARDHKTEQFIAQRPDGVAALKQEREVIARRMDELQREFVDLKAKRDRIDKALAVLTAPAGAEIEVPRVGVA